MSAAKRVHILDQGLAVCGVGVPSGWLLDTWVRREEAEHATCPLCLEARDARRACPTHSGCHGTGSHADAGDSGSGREVYCDCLAGWALRWNDRDAASLAEAERLVRAGVVSAAATREAKTEAARVRASKVGPEGEAALLEGRIFLVDEMAVSVDFGNGPDVACSVLARKKADGTVEVIRTDIWPTVEQDGAVDLDLELGVFGEALLVASLSRGGRVVETIRTASASGMLARMQARGWPCPLARPKEVT